ncbi:hypothetical protein tinsulaeT_31050 [Thalassotalea insulae]|uniref:EAL domain-containing protein n=1 Tax=Thalassotalea insulae TaxID=2056778 RepID=A0ABQ6GZ35_9GAMM|nr:EAL domain-containing protein [Thalassotalea insulae]GLX79765.1 hypothetical protein tinsulaeT_31050 [Thalassotalea insulae]
MIKLLKSKLLIKFIIRSVVLLFISVFCIEYVTYNKTSAMIQLRINEQLQHEIKQQAQVIEQQIHQLTLDAKVLAELPAVEELILNKQYGLLTEAQRIVPLIEKFIDNQMVRNNNYIQFGICNKNQQLVFNYPRVNSQENLLACDENAVPELTLINHQSMMLTRNYIKRNNKPLGSAFIVFNTERIFTDISNKRILNHGFWALFDQDMTLLTGLDDNNQQFSKVVKQHNINAGNVEMLTIARKAAYLYPFKIKATNWQLFAVAYQDEMFKDVIELLYLLSFVVLLVFIGEVIFLSYFTHSIVIKPINALLSATKHITQGNYQQKIAVKHSDEIGLLTKTFNTMTATIAEQIAKLNWEKQQSHESKALLQSIIDNTPDIIYLKAIDHRYLLVNQAYLSLFNIQAEDILGKSDKELFPKELADAFIENDNQVIQHQKAFRFDEMAVDKNNTTRHYISVKFPLFDQQDHLYATCGISTDVTEIKEKEIKLRALNQELKLIYNIFETGKESIVITDENWQITDANRALITNFDFNKSDILNTPAFNLIAEHEQILEEIQTRVNVNGYWQGEVLLYSSTKQGYPQLCSINKVSDSEFQTTHYIMLFSDITQLKETQKQLEKLAHYDSLTGLFNRYQFNIAVHKAIFESQENNDKFALFFIDLDNFKYINDTMGHEIGDAFLQEVAQRLKTVTRSSDVVARFGGDEFVLLMKNLREQDYISMLANKVREAVNSAFTIENKEIYASASIGIALYPQDGTSCSELLKAADIAMYSAKDKGKNAYQFFMPEMNQAIKEKLNYEESLRNAIECDEFEFHYQAKHTKDNNSIIKAEGLLRWRKKDGQLVMPDEFIAIAEESGLIVPISYHIFDHGCRFINALEQQFNKPVELSFNLSGRQFRQHDLAQKLHQITQQHQISPGSIEFEITESVIMEDPKLTQSICQQIKAIGFKISLDDFGTGYSSLSYIRDYPIDSIKVDRGFITDVETDVTKQAIINAVLSIAQSMGLEVICEGVETKNQLVFLQQMGVNTVQGYYFSKPLAEQEFICYVKENY